MDVRVTTSAAEPSDMPVFDMMLIAPATLPVVGYDTV
jgi:hypothetical protein